MEDHEKVKILVVDDLPDKLLVYRTVLEELGEIVITATSGGEALKHVLRHDFAVILLDVNMPGMDGFETAALLRKRAKSVLTPIIFITAFVDELHHQQGYAQGAVDYILAPFDPKVLRAKVKVFIDLFRMQRDTERRANERVVLAEERARRMAAEKANLATTFLAQASTTLSRSLDDETTLEDLVRLCVPYAADLCIVELRDEAHQTADVYWSHQSPADSIVHGSGCLEPFVAPIMPILDRVIASGLKELRFQGLQEQPGKEASKSRDSLVVLPMIARGKTLGSIAFGYGPSGRCYSENDLPFLEDLASRAGMTLHNALLLKKIRESDRRKDEFLAMLAHELRNPLAPIRNTIEILRQSEHVESRHRSAHDLIDRQLVHLTRLVDDLLDVSRLTQGKIRLDREVFDVAEAAHRAVEASKPLINSRRHRLSFSLPPEPVHIKGDPVRITQVLSNLLNNAAKYTKEGGCIWLTVDCLDLHARLTVKDTGDGIPQQLLDSVFDLFTQIDTSFERSQGGLGIGLTLVKRLVEMHGGSVSAASEGPGKGSTFTVLLPALNGVHHKDQLVNGKTTEVTPCRILIVDDNRDSAQSMAELLTLTGFHTHVAFDGVAAVEDATRLQPEIILMDLGLPKMNGFDAARRIRREPWGKSTVLVALTGWSQEADYQKSRSAGFDSLMVKPVEFPSLLKLLSELRSR